MQPHELYMRQVMTKQAFVGAIAGALFRGVGTLARGAGSAVARAGGAVRGAVAKIPPPPAPKAPVAPRVSPVVAQNGRVNATVAKPPAKMDMGKVMDHVGTASNIASVMPRGGQQQPKYDPNSMLGDRQGQIGYQN